MLLRIAHRKNTSKWTALMTAVALAVAPMAALAQENKGPPILRDTESEALLREYTRPILRTAGLEKQNIQMVIINESVFNAFVADGRRIFVNYGAIMQSETPNQIIGVLAHETGHLAGGHLAKMREQLAQAQTQMIIAMLLGAGALVAGARGGGNSGLANAGAAAVAGPQEMIRRNLISYVRQQEENADRAGVKFLTATGQSAKGMYETFKRFTNESLFAAHGADPYLQSHPMPAERVAALEELARSSPYWDKKDDPALQLRHDMMRAKISGFMERQDTVYRRYPMSDTSLPGRYANLIEVRFGRAGHLGDDRGHRGFFHPPRSGTSWILPPAMSRDRAALRSLIAGRQPRQRRAARRPQQRTPAAFDNSGKARTSARPARRTAHPPW